MSLRRITGTDVDARRAGIGGAGLTFLMGAGGGGGVAIFTGGLTYRGVSIGSTKTIDTHIPLVAVVNSLSACRKRIQGVYPLWI
jgi:hypothetical protein